MSNNPNQNGNRNDSHIDIVLTLEYWPGTGFTQISYRLFATPTEQYDPTTQYGDRPSKITAYDVKTGELLGWKPGILHAFQGTINLGREKNLVDFLHTLEGKLISVDEELKLRHHYHSLGPTHDYGDRIVEESGDGKYRVPLDKIPLERTGLVYDWSKLPEQFSDAKCAEIDMDEFKQRFLIIAEKLGLIPYCHECN